MKSLGTSLANQKSLIKIIEILLILGFLIGFLIYQKLDKTTIAELIKDLPTALDSNNINFIINHLIILSILFTCSFTIIGIIAFFICFIYEGISISIGLFLFIKVFHLKGFIYGLIYIILTKLIYLILLFIILKKVLKTLKIIIESLPQNHNQDFKYIFLKNIKTIIISIALILINDLLIYFIIDKILLKLTFIIS